MHGPDSPRHPADHRCRLAARDAAAAPHQGWRGAARAGAGRAERRQQPPHHGRPLCRPGFSTRPAVTAGRARSEHPTGKQAWITPGELCTRLLTANVVTAWYIEGGGDRVIE